MFLTLEWKRARRSAEFHRNLGAKIVWSILIGILMLEVLLFGVMMGHILAAEFPGRDPVTAFNSILLLYYSVDLLSRLFGQKLQTIAAKPFLTVPLPRFRIVRFILGRSLLTMFNIVPLLMFIPVSIVVVGANLGALSAIAWLAAVISLMWGNTFAAAFVKTRMLLAPKGAGVVIVAMVILVGMEFAGVISPAPLSSLVFDAFARTPVFSLVPLAFTGLLAVITGRSFGRMLSLDLAGGPRARRSRGRWAEVFQGRSPITRLIALDLRMLLRNRRSKPILVLSLLFVFYGLLLYAPGGREPADLMILLIGFFITGLFAVSFGSLTFSWESAFFGVYVSRPLDWEDFLKAKYLLMSAAVAGTFVLGAFYIVFGWRVIVAHAVSTLFNIGVTIPLMLWLATFNRLRFDLNAGAFSAQGKTGVQYGAMFAVMFLLVLLYVPGWFLFGGNGGFAVIGAVGLIGIAFRRTLIRAITVQALQRRYRMTAGFRQS